MIDVLRARQFFSELDRIYSGRAEIFLVGETSQLMEGWQRWVMQLDFCSLLKERGQRDPFDTILRDLSIKMETPVVDEYPGDVIPLPGGYTSRARALSDTSWMADSGIKFWHFDPYSVSYRYMARGGETDYAMILRFLEHGWITEDEMEERLEELLPNLTFETIQQDPAELRRRYGGLKQMWRARLSSSHHQSLS